MKKATILTDEEKRLALLELRAEVIREWWISGWREVWFYPEWKGVKGWQGIVDIFFVGPNPSTGWFPSRDDEFLYEALALKGFHHAHITDAIKLRLTGENIDTLVHDKPLITKHERYFSQELAILRPRLIVSMGRIADRILREWVQSGPKVERIVHYVPRFIKKENLPGFHKQFLHELDRVRALYDAMRSDSQGR